MEALPSLLWVAIAIVTIIWLVITFLIIRFLCSVPTQLWRIANTLEDFSDAYYENNKKS